jgi:hypothetical protein
MGSWGFDRIANLRSLIFYNHGQNPSNLEQLSTILPKYKNVSFKPQIEEENLGQYMIKFLQEELKEDKKIRE